MFKSTRDFFREARKQKGYGLFDVLHAYVYMRWPYRYIAAALFLLEPPAWLARLIARSRAVRPGAAQDDGKPRLKFRDTYHAKVVPLETARKLIMVERELSQVLPEQVLPFALAREIVLKRSQSLAVLDCPCRSSMPNPCLPLGVCLIVGEPFVSFVTEHNPAKARRITAEEAVRILQDEEARGHVRHAFFKDVMLGRFYAICNCCSCCCVAMRSQRAGSGMLAPSGYSLKIDAAACRGCGECLEFCSFKALHVTAGKCRVRQRRCMGCGACLVKCRFGALSLELDPKKGEPLPV